MIFCGSKRVETKHAASRHGDQIRSRVEAEGSVEAKEQVETKAGSKRNGENCRKRGRNIHGSKEDQTLFRSSLLVMIGSNPDLFQPLSRSI